MALAGIGSKGREDLATVLRAARGIITVKTAAKALGQSSKATAKKLSQWTERGWLTRIKRNAYIPVALEARSADAYPADPWVMASELWKPCYIGGWSAAEHWGLTEQLFRSTLVFTSSRPRRQTVELGGAPFLLRSVRPASIFGTKVIWRDQSKVLVSDPSRTIIDLMNDPRSGGGLRPSVDIFLGYLNSENKDVPRLLDYAKKFGNGAVYKRLGYLTEKYADMEVSIIKTCLKNLTKGNARLDPRRKKVRLKKKWRTWLPEGW